ncbi:MAG TPA: phosphodiester glycosidase family protein, partial [Candidatus Acidoferrales bacterium]
SYRHLRTTAPTGEPWSIHVLEVDRRARGIEIRAVGAVDEAGHMARGLPSALGENEAAAVAVVNGDYDLPAPYLGVSDGLAVTSRRVWTTGRPGWPVMAIRGNGTPVINVPEVSLELKAGSRAWAIGALNKPLGSVHGRGPRGYTRDFRGKISSNTPFQAIVIKNLSPGLPLQVDRRVRGEVVEVMESATEVAIPPDALVVVERRAPAAPGESASKPVPPLVSLRQGDKVTLEIRIRVAGENGIRDAVGGFPILVRGGQRDIVGAPSANLRQRHPRTAACYNREKIIFVVVDGRQPELSHGMTLEELADLMVSLGCEVAMNTDGGGSSVMAVALPAGGTNAPRDGGQRAAPLQIVNSPSDGRERGRGNAWVILRR